MKKGILIAIEGTDGSGKATQTKLLKYALEKEGYYLKKLSFPCYDSPSSSLVKMYLNGEFGGHADDVNPFAASTFYAVDRYASYRKDWGKFYKEGGLIITDRYTTSNAIHQGAKLEGEEKQRYLDWLYEFEYHKMGIPEPDMVIYLDMPTELTAQLRAEREERTNTKPDIHEKDMEYLRKCRESALGIAQSSNWVVINCAASDTEMRSIKDIHQEVLDTVRAFLKDKDDGPKILYYEAAEELPEIIGSGSDFRRVERAYNEEDAFKLYNDNRNWLTRMVRKENGRFREYWDPFTQEWKD